MKNIEKYLGVSKLTSEYKGIFFDTDTLNFLKIEIGEVLKTTDEEIVFVTSTKKYNKKTYSLLTLSYFGDTSPYVLNLSGKKFSTSEEASAYFKTHQK
jgi:hypothetical protein